MKEKTRINTVEKFFDFYLDKLDSKELIEITKRVVSKLLEVLEPVSDMESFWEFITNPNQIDKMSDEEKKAVACMMPLACKAKNNLIIENAF